MRWTLEMEEEFIDLEIMKILLDEKRNVKGNFDDGIYIKEKRTEFSKISLLNNEIELYLPEDKAKKEHYGKEFAYPEKMGTYEEYVILNESMCFTIEKPLETNVLSDMEEWKEYTIDGIEDNNGDTVVTQIEDLSIDGIQIHSLMIKGFIGEEVEQYTGYVYLIICGTHIYRMYIMSVQENWELTYKLGNKIVENIEIKAG